MGLLSQIHKEFQEINKWKLNQKEGKEYEQVRPGKGNLDG